MPSDPSPQFALPQRQRARWQKRLLAFALSASFCFGLLELLCRWRLGAPWSERLPILRVQANPYRGWEMLPGEDHYTYQELVQINQYGLRGAEIAAKQPQESRVLCLGDSLVYGQGVADDQTLPHWLEQELAQRGPTGARWRAINAGLRAYGTQQELGLLRELGAALQPDVVVLFWYWNDLVERSIADTHARLQQSGPIAFDTGAPMQGATLWRWRAKQTLRRSALVMYVWDQWRARKGGFFTPEVVEQGLRDLGAALQDLRQQCQRLGARPLFVAIPDAACLQTEHQSRALCLRALDCARAQEIEALDLLPALQSAMQQEEARWVIPFDGHYTGAANRVMAQALAKLF